MRIAPRDIEKLWLHTACVVAQKRYARGLKLNYPEAMALLSGQLLELIRDGHSLQELNELGRSILGTDDVLPGVAEMIEEVQVEGTLVDGTKLVSIHFPICKSGLGPDLALYGSGLVRNDLNIATDNVMGCVPGTVEVGEEPVEINIHRETLTLEVTNTGSRPVQVGSHCNFVETNRALQFDRVKTIGYRLNIAAGTAVRWEPGETKTVELVEIAGQHKIYGGNRIVEGKYAGRTEDIADRIKDFLK
ncbi:MAG: urease subunit beta [Bacteroidales bacterium]|nr:urease subunit beta [Bacteroidales bacterium]